MIRFLVMVAVAIATLLPVSVQADRFVQREANRHGLFDRGLSRSSFVDAQVDRRGMFDRGIGRSRFVDVQVGSQFSQDFSRRERFRSRDFGSFSNFNSRFSSGYGQNFVTEQFIDEEPIVIEREPLVIEREPLIIQRRSRIIQEQRVCPPGGCDIW